MRSSVLVARLTAVLAILTLGACASNYAMATDPPVDSSASVPKIVSPSPGIPPELNNFFGRFRAHFGDTIVITTRNGVVVVEYFNGAGQRLGVRGTLTVADGRVRLKLHNMVLARWNVTISPDLTFYPEYEGGTFMGDAQTPGFPLTGIKYHRVQ